MGVSRKKHAHQRGILHIILFKTSWRQRGCCQTMDDNKSRTLLCPVKSV